MFRQSFAVALRGVCFKRPRSLRVQYLSTSTAPDIVDKLALDFERATPESCDWDDSDGDTNRWKKCSILCSHPGDDDVLNNIDGFADLKKAASKALNQGKDGEQLFVDTAIKALKLMGSIRGRPRNPFASSEHLMFLGTNSPVHEPLVQGLTLCFNRALCAGESPDNTPNNVSGMCLSGARRVGKSHLLRSVALAATSLLPNFVAVTIDATRGSVPNCGPDQHGIDVLNAVQRQYAVLGLDVSQKKTIGSILDVASRHGLATGVFVDEARHLYTRTLPHTDLSKEWDTDSSWEQVHEVLEDFEACTFFADSMSILPAMVRGETSRLSRLGFQKLRPTLNGTKMRVVQVPPLSDPVQYRAYAADRSDFSSRLVPEKDDPTGFRNNKATIDAWHTVSGGCFRQLQALHSRGGSVDIAKRKLPAEGTLGRVLLQELVKKAQKDATAFDPFNLPRISEAAMMVCVDKHPQSTYLDLVELAETGVLSMVNNHGPHHTEFTFSSPAQLMLLNNWSPTLFVSHAVADAEDNPDLWKTLLTELEHFHIHPVLWQDCVGQLTTEEIVVWEQKHLERVRENPTSHVMAVFSDNYVQRLGDKSSGVYREATFINRLIGDPETERRVRLGLISDQVDVEAIRKQIPEEFGNIEKKFKHLAFDIGNRGYATQVASHILALPAR